MEPSLGVTLLQGRSTALCRQFRAILIANGMRSPRNATNSKRATYQFLIANEFHVPNPIFHVSCKSNAIPLPLARLGIVGAGFQIRPRRANILILSADLPRVSLMVERQTRPPNAMRYW